LRAVQDSGRGPTHDPTYVWSTDKKRKRIGVQSLAPHTQGEDLLGEGRRRTYGNFVEEQQLEEEREYSDQSW